MTAPRFAGITPRLPAADLRKTVLFYRDILGFSVEVVWPPEAPEFVILRRDDVAVGFFTPSEHHDGPVGYVELYVEVVDARALHEQLKTQVMIEWGPEVYAYGRREFALRDPDRYLLIFTEPTDEAPTTHEP